MAPQPGMPRNPAPMPPGYGMTQEQALQYQTYIQQQQQQHQQQQAAAGQYPMPPQGRMAPHPQH